MHSICDSIFGGNSVGNGSANTQPRATTPEPLRRIRSIQKPPAPYRNLERGKFESSEAVSEASDASRSHINFSKADMICAEDDDTSRAAKLPPFKSFSVDSVDLIIASVEPLSRMHAIVAFGKAGVSQEQIIEVGSGEELFQALSKAQEEVSQRPLVLILMEHGWAVKFHKMEWAVKSHQLKRQPFIIYTPDVDAQLLGKSGVEEMASYFDAFLPLKFGKNDVELCVTLLRLWWLTRGDGPQDASGSLEVMDHMDLLRHGGRSLR